MTGESLPFFAENDKVREQLFIVVVVVVGRDLHNGVVLHLRVPEEKNMESIKKRVL